MHIADNPILSPVPCLKDFVWGGWGLISHYLDPYHPDMEPVSQEVRIRGVGLYRSISVQETNIAVIRSCDIKIQDGRDFRFLTKTKEIVNNFFLNSASTVLFIKQISGEGRV